MSEELLFLTSMAAAAPTRTKPEPSPSEPQKEEGQSQHNEQQQTQDEVQHSPKTQQEEQNVATAVTAAAGPPNLLKRWRMTRQSLSQNIQETFSVTSKSFLPNPYENKQRYERTKESLPPPPKGMVWVQEELSREWRLEKKKVEEGEKKVVEIVVEKPLEKEEEEEEEESKVQQEEEEEKQEVVAVEGLAIATPPPPKDKQLEEEEEEETKSSDPQESSNIFRTRSNSIHKPPTHPAVTTPNTTSNSQHPAYIPLCLPPQSSRDSFSKEGSKSKGAEQDAWSLISSDNPGTTTDAKSNSSSGIVISISSSLRSATNNSSKQQCHQQQQQQQQQLSPIALERSWSTSSTSSDSSTIASNDITGYGVPNVDYIEHVVLPTDTIEGICLAYKISKTRLRQANYFSGSTLLLAPKKLIIPLSQRAYREAPVGGVGGIKRRQDRSTEVYKVQAFLAEVGCGFSSEEAKTYLDLSNWDVDEALRTAYEDLAWNDFETNEISTTSTTTTTPRKHPSSSRAGQQELRITLSLHPKNNKGGGGGGSGKSTNVRKDNATTTTTCLNNISPSHSNYIKRREEKRGIAVDTRGAKCVTPQDVYQASLSHDLCGVELKEISSPATSDGPDVMENQSSSSSPMPSFPLPRI